MDHKEMMSKLEETYQLARENKEACVCLAVIETMDRAEATNTAAQIAIDLIKKD